MVIVNALKLLAVMVAAIAVGNWFLAETRRSRMRKDPWYRPYLTIPGLLIVAAAIGLPVLAWLARH